MNNSLLYTILYNYNIFIVICIICFFFLFFSEGAIILSYCISQISRSLWRSRTTSVHCTVKVRNMKRERNKGKCSLVDSLILHSAMVYFQQLSCYSLARIKLQILKIIQKLGYKNWNIDCLRFCTYPFEHEFSSMSQYQLPYIVQISPIFFVASISLHSKKPWIKYPKIAAKPNVVSRLLRDTFPSSNASIYRSMKEYEISEQTRRALEQTSRKVKYRSITTILSNAWKSPCKCEGFLKLAIAWNSENKHGVAGESIELTLEIARLFERFNLLLRANIYVARKREREREREFWNVRINPIGFSLCRESANNGRVEQRDEETKLRKTSAWRFLNSGNETAGIVAPWLF